MREARAGAAPLWDSGTCQPSMHPSVATLLAGAAAAHVRTCAACRAVTSLAAPAAAAASPDRDLDELPLVDRGLYCRWRELAAGPGGMGRIFRARDRRLGRDVAIKMVGDRAREPSLRAALQRRLVLEAQLTASLHHPAIVAVYEAGRFGDGEPFYAMPLMRGRSLDAEIARRPLLADRLALLPRLRLVCEAVAYAHRKGVVHRDLKPHNIMIGRFGETVVIDWGVAHDLGQPSDATLLARRCGQLGDGLTCWGLGTPPYLAPEQARGAAASAAMDIHALGATLFHLLVGDPPYGHDRWTQPSGHPAPSPALRERAAGVPPGLLAVVARAMARDPAMRFASAGEVASALRRFPPGPARAPRHRTSRRSGRAAA